MLTIIICGIHLVSCKLTMEEPTYWIHITNNSKEKIYVICRWNTEEGLLSKETKLGEDSSIYENTYIEPNWSRDIWGFSDEPEIILKSTDTVTLFILEKEAYEGKKWKQLIDSAQFRQIYHLSGDDIRLIGRKIPYPPTEIMRDMDIIPKYGEQEETD